MLMHWVKLYEKDSFFPAFILLLPCRRMPYLGISKKMQSWWIKISLVPRAQIQNPFYLSLVQVSIKYVLLAVTVVRNGSLWDTYKKYKKYQFKKDQTILIGLCLLLRILSWSFGSLSLVRYICLKSLYFSLLL